MKRWMVLIFCILLFACKPQTETVQVGAILSFTGPAAAFGEEARRGIDLAVEEINSQGGIDGKEVSVVYEDDATNPTKAVSAWSKVVNVDGVVGVIGGTWDFNYNAIAPLAEQDSLVLITPQNLKTPGMIMNNYTFTMRPHMTTVVGTLEEYMAESGYTKVAYVRFVSPFGEAMGEGLEMVMANVDGEVVLEETYDSIGGNDFLTVTEKVKESGAEAVLIDMVGPDVLTFLKRLKENKMNIQVLAHTGMLDVYNTPDVDMNLLDGVVYFDWDQPPTEEFVSKYEAKYGEKPKRSADGAYDAMKVLAEGLGSGKEVNKYLEDNSFETVNGKFNFVDHVINTRIVYVQEIVDGKINTIYTQTVNT